MVSIIAIYGKDSGDVFVITQPTDIDWSGTCAWDRRYDVVAEPARPATGAGQRRGAGGGAHGGHPANPWRLSEPRGQHGARGATGDSDRRARGPRYAATT